MSNPAPYIRPAKLRTRAVLQYPAEVVDGGGGVAVTWTNEKTFWCHIRERGGKERDEAMQEQQTLTHEILARYDSAFTHTKRVTFSGRVYNIRAILNPGAQNEFVRILCESGVAT